MEKTFLRKLGAGMGAMLLAGLCSFGALAEAAKTPAAAPAKTAVQAQTININKADAATMADGLQGVGLKKAEAIVAWRTSNGAFSSADQLLEVKGIGPAILAKNKELITLN